MSPRSLLLSMALLGSAIASFALPQAIESPAHLNDPFNPYYPHTKFPKLTTPMWVGETGVEAVVVLAIDDMGEDTAKYEAYLRPILDRLKRLDGRAALSIMTNRADPANPRLQAWLKEGVSIECHTRTHPCPLLQKGDLAAASETYHSCVDRMSQIPGNTPVAFRMPCCDSMNSVSPRFFEQIFNRTSPEGRFLQVDSSVFCLLTPDDPRLPRSLVFDEQGNERFRKYASFPSFVNTIENYPYPYVIGNQCWEFPCVVPSDWEAQNLQSPNNPRTVLDLKAALDAVVIKQGVMNLVFHPHGWIENTQVVELIDHAAKEHGGKVKFLTFRAALERLNQHLLAGQSLRDAEPAARGGDNGVRLLDLNGDGFLDVVIANGRTRRTRVWNPVLGSWVDGAFPLALHAGDRSELGQPPRHAPRFGMVRPGLVTVFSLDTVPPRAFTFDGLRWNSDDTLARIPDSDRTRGDARHLGVCFRDLDGDGRDELLHANLSVKRVYRWSDEQESWVPLPFGLPGDARIAGVSYLDGAGARVELPDADAGLRFVDLDRDGRLDVVFSGPHAFGIWLFDDMTSGWSREVLSGVRGADDALHGDTPFPPIVRLDRAAKRVENNGFFVHSASFWWQNENTSDMPQHVDRRGFAGLLQATPTRARSVAEALASFDLKPGFVIDVVASEPLVQDPVAFDVGADGRLWVVEMGDYPLGEDGKGSPGGRVRVLNDDDGDGRYDRSTLFLDGLRYPNGIQCWRDGVIISAAPDIFFAADDDGDGKADRREVLLTGFEEANPQHRVNGFALGFDGWLHAADGSSERGVRSLKLDQIFALNGRDFRFDPETGRFALTSGRGQFGRQRNDWGDWFANDNSTWARHVVMDDATLARNPALAVAVPFVVLEPDRRLFPASPIVARFNDLDNAGLATSANCPAPYRDDLLGAGFASSLFVSEPVHNLVHRVVLDPDGATYRGRRASDERGREFLASADTWFRPTMIKTGPDGALWIADMYRAVIEHPEWIPDDWEATIDLRAGHDKGRIYRVYPVDRTPRPIPRLQNFDTTGLVSALDSANGPQRDAVMRLLLHRRESAAIEPLRGLVRGASNPRVRLQALVTLALLDGLDDATLLVGLNDSHPEVRRWSAETAGARATGNEGLAERLVALARDPEPRVLFGTALGLGDWKDARAARALYEIFSRAAEDPWVRTAALSSARPHAREILANLLGPEQAVDLPARVLDPLWNTLLLDKEASESLGLLLARLLGPNPEETQPAAVAGLLEALARQGRSLDDLLRRLAPDLQRVLHDRLKALARDATATAINHELADAPRLDALRLLARRELATNETSGAVATLLDARTPAAIQRAALNALISLRVENLPELILAGWKSHTPGVREAALSALIARDEWAQALLDRVEQGDIARTEVGSSHRQRLLRSGSSSIRERAAALFGTASEERSAVIALYRAQLPAAGAGDATAGRAVFGRVCASCHELGGVGLAVGPDLRGLTDRSTEAMLVALFDPNRAVEPAYVEYAIETKDGRVLAGLVAAETANSVTLRRQNAEEDVLLRSEISEMSASGRSLMPEGLEQNLSARDLADLLVFLDATLPPPKSFAGNQPAVSHQDSTGTVRLAAETAEIRGSSLVFEEHYKNLGYWSSESDNATWNFEVNSGGVFEVTIDFACPADSAGNTVMLQVGEQSLRWNVRSTRSWDDYQTHSIGTVRLAPGRHKLVARSDGPIRAALLDLRAIVLTARTGN